MPDKNARRAPIGEILTRDFLILSTINLAVFFGFQMINVGLPVYLDQLGAGAHLVGLATTLMTVTATLMRIFSGALLDRFGRVGILVAGTAIILCAIVLYAIFPVVGIILGLRLLHGVGWGLGSTASSTIAADIIPKHRFAEGMGYFAMTTSIASALAPAASIQLVQGAGAIYMIWASAGCTVIALVLAIVQARLRKNRQKGPEVGGQPGAAGGPGAGEQPDTAGAPGAGGPGASGPGAGATPTAGAPMQQLSKLETLFERRALFPGLLMLLVNVGFGCITTFIALHGLAQGVGGVSIYFLVYAIATLVSRPYIGRLIDRYGYRMPAILATLCTAATLAVIGVASSTLMFGIAGVLGGLGIGTAMGTFQTMAVASVEPWRRGVATSTYMTAFDTGIALGSLAGGVIAGAFGYTAMYFAVAAFPLVATVIALVAIPQGEGVAANR